MRYELYALEMLPLRSGISVTQALMDLKPKGNIGHIDVECSRKWSAIPSKSKAKNAKAKHRKKYAR